jgi:hypothetical protein
MDKKEMAVAQEEDKAQVEEIEFTEDQNKAQTRMFENDFINGLIAAAGFRTDEAERKHIEISRGGILFFAFDIRALGEDEYNRCKTKHTKYVRNKQLGIKLPEDTNTVKYRCAIIYQATVEEDRAKLWDNKKIWAALNEKGCQIMNGLDVIEYALKSGEKERIIEEIDKLSGYDSSDNLEEVAKN